MLVVGVVYGDDVLKEIGDLVDHVPHQKSLTTANVYGSCRSGFYIVLKYIFVFLSRAQEFPNSVKIQSRSVQKSTRISRNFLILFLLSSPHVFDHMHIFPPTKLILDIWEPPLSWNALLVELIWSSLVV